MFAKKVIECTNWYHNNSVFYRTKAAEITFVSSIHADGCGGAASGHHLAVFCSIQIVSESRLLSSYLASTQLYKLLARYPLVRQHVADEIKIQDVISQNIAADMRVMRSA